MPATATHCASAALLAACPPARRTHLNASPTSPSATLPAGPILAFIYALKELLEDCKAGGTCLPTNVVFLFEGEEENGSTGFREAVQQNLRWFEGVRLVLISNTLWVGERLPCMTYGMRGMIRWGRGGEESSAQRGLQDGVQAG